MQLLTGAGYEPKGISGDGSCLFSALGRMCYEHLQNKDMPKFDQANDDSAYADAFKTWLKIKIEKHLKEKNSQIKELVDNAILTVKADNEPSGQSLMLSNESGLNIIIDYLNTKKILVNKWNSGKGDVIYELAINLAAFYSEKPVYFVTKKSSENNNYLIQKFSKNNDMPESEFIYSPESKKYTQQYLKDLVNELGIEKSTSQLLYLDQVQKHYDILCKAP